ncbi:MAG: hypothetical protein AAF823_02540 [Planctomycetota bacterium]
MIDTIVPTKHSSAIERRGDWLHARRWGVCVHYLADQPGQQRSAEMTPAEWNRRIDAFNPRAFVDTVSSAGVGYVVFTIGQNSGYFCSPNQTYSQILGRPAEEDRLSRHDLIADISTEASKVDLPVIAYLPSHAPANDLEAIRRLGCTPGWDMGRVGVSRNKYDHADPDPGLAAFQRRWESIIREWSLRWGKGVAGWWIDGCCFADRMYRNEQAPNFFSFADALRAGNPDAIVAFNGGTGIPPKSMTPAEDYTSGETNHLVVEEHGWRPRRWVDGKQLHLITYLGKAWGVGPPRFTAELASEWTRHAVGLGGAVTWDVPIATDGTISDDCLDILRHIGRQASTWKTTT